MKTSKATILLVWTVTMLHVGASACAKEQSKTIVSSEADAEPAEAATMDRGGASVRSRTVPDDAEPNAAEWETTLKVKLVLLEKLGVDSLHVDVVSHGGVLTLGGIVNERETKELAETIAKSIPSVTRVHNDIRLESSLDNPNKASVMAGEAAAELKDAMLSTKVRLALLDVLGASGIRVGTEVANGVVTLEFAPDLAKTGRTAALKAAKHIDGVTKVVSIDKT